MKIVFENVSFSYKDHMVFENINYETEKVGFISLIGANGAGKSTLLKCINGIHSPSSGRILANEEDVAFMKLKKRASIFGYVPQFTTINPCLNVLETVVSGRMVKMSGKARAEDIDAAEEILVELGLANFAMRPLQQLSGGERQRVLMARAMAQSPKVLLLDEPTSNLDLHYQLETMELMKKLVTKKSIGVIAVIHDLNAVLRYADEAILLNDGKIIACGDPRKIINQSTLEEAFRIKATFTDTTGISVMVPVESVYQ